MALTYPHTPGHKGRDTAIAAAKGVAPKVGTLKARVLEWLREHGPATPEEVSAATGIHNQTVRSRCSELSSVGLLEDSGERGPAIGGRQAIKWRVRPPARPVSYGDHRQ